MIFLADESLEFPLVSGLRERGMDCRAILEEYPGIPDDEVLEKSLSLDAILLTEDRISANWSCDSICSIAVYCYCDWMMIWKWKEN